MCIRDSRTVGSNFIAVRIHEFDIVQLEFLAHVAERRNRAVSYTHLDVYKRQRDMRDNQPQETDGANDGGGNARQQHRDHRNDDPAAGDVYPQAPRRFVLQGQQIALSQHEDGGDQTNDYIE